MAAADTYNFARANKAKYESQARLYLNAFWVEEQSSAEQIWQWCQGFIAADLHLKGLRPPSPDSEGTEIEEHGFHYFLEKNIEPLTVLEARKNLRTADVSKDGKVSFLEFLFWKQGKFGQAEFDKRRPSDPLSQSVEKMTPALRKAKAALAAVNVEIAKIESEKYRLTELSEAGGVKGIRAKSELAALLAADPTELNRALLTAEAAVRKAGGNAKDLPPGSTWWMDRTLQMMRQFMPSKKQ